MDFFNDQLAIDPFSAAVACDRWQAIRTWRPYVAWKKHTLRRWMGLWCWKRGGEVRGVQELLNML